MERLSLLAPCEVCVGKFSVCVACGEAVSV